ARAHLGKRITDPANFFQKTGWDAKSNSQQKAVWSENRRYKRLQREKGNSDQHRRQNQNAVPAQRRANWIHPREEIPQALGTVDDSGKNTTGETRTNKHGWEGQDRGHLRRADPGDRECEEEVGEDRAGGPIAKLPVQ